MNTAIATEQWLGVESSELLEKRTYKSGQVRWYSKGFYACYRLEASTAKHWLMKKYFVKQDEYDAIKAKETDMMMLRYTLRLAQRAGGFKTTYERDKERRQNAECRL